MRLNDAATMLLLPPAFALHNIINVNFSVTVYWFLRMRTWPLSRSLVSQTPHLSQLKPHPATNNTECVHHKTNKPDYPHRTQKRRPAWTRPRWTNNINIGTRSTHENPQEETCVCVLCVLYWYTHRAYMVVVVWLFFSCVFRVCVYLFQIVSNSNHFESSTDRRKTAHRHNLCHPARF